MSYLAKPHAKATKIVAPTPSVKFAMSLFDVYYQSRSRRRKLCQCCFWLRQHEVPKNSTRVDQDAGIKQGVPVQVHKGQNFAFINRTVVHNGPRGIYNSVPLVVLCQTKRIEREFIISFFKKNLNRPDEQGVLGASTQEQELLSCQQTMPRQIESSASLVIIHNPKSRGKKNPI